MATQIQDDEDDIQDASDAAEQQAPGAKAPPVAPGQYSDNDKLGMAAVALLTPLLGGLIGGRTGALAGGAAGAQGVEHQIQSDTAFQRELALSHQRYGLQNKLPFETRTVMDKDGNPTYETYNKATGEWVPSPRKLAYTPTAEKNFVAPSPAVAATAAAPAADQDEDSVPPPAPVPAAPVRGPRPTDPVEGAIYDLDGQKPSAADLDPTPRAGESIAKAEVRAKQAQQDYQTVAGQQAHLRAASALAAAADARKQPEKQAAAAEKSDARAEKDDAKDKNQIETDAQKLQAAMNGSRAGQGVTQNILKINAGEKIQNLLSKYPDGNVPVSLMPELALGLGNLMAPGSVTEAQVHALDQKSLERDVKAKLQYFTGSSEDADTPELVKLMSDSIDREIGVARDQLGRHAAELGNSFARFKKKEPDRFYGIVGLDAKDFDAKGKYVNKTIGRDNLPAPHPQDSQAIEWANANRNSSDSATAAKAQKILQLNGAK